jgi:tetratricopeptide (TPR) repeat protein
MPPGKLDAGLGTSFELERPADLVRITAPDGTEVEIPGPDLRECLDWLAASSTRLSTSPYGELVERVRAELVVLESRVVREERSASETLERLLSRPAGERIRLCEHDALYRTYSLARRALDRSRHESLRDPALALELAELGRHIASLLDPQMYGGPQVRDLQAGAEAVYGNGLRLVGDLGTALSAFQRARGLLELGSGDPSEALEVDDLESSLRRVLRDFPRALELSQRVVEGNLELGQTAAAAQALQQRAIMLDEMGEVDAAIEVLQIASVMAASESSPLLVCTIRHSLAVCLARSGRPSEAAELLAENRDLYGQLSSPKIDGCRLWLEGLIALESGRPAAAAERLARSRSTFGEHGFGYDLAQVSLDLAEAFASLGRFADIRELAAETYLFMESRHVHPDALAALAVFSQAAAREQLDRELLRSLARRLERAATSAPPRVC